MTTMQQIAHINNLAKAEGMSYASYIKKYGEPFPKPPPLKENERICKRCGEVFELKLTKEGTLSKNTSCDACIEKRRRARGSRKKSKVICNK